ncbi:putative FlgJ-like protein [Thiovulum sp. ES]|nr:putative FlgJ-like protein [Thiovulum sp. ES]
MSKENSYKISLFVLVVIIITQIFYILNLKNENIDLKKVVVIEAKSDEKLKTDIFEKVGKENWKIEHKIDFNSLKKKYSGNIIEKDISKMSVEEKKKHFLETVLSPIRESYDKLVITYKNVSKLRSKELTIEDEEYLTILYDRYRVKKGDFDSLLKAIKPHPVSLIISQAILSSGWGESRFFSEGNNIFSLISIDDKDDRMKAKNANVYMKKYDSLVESVDDYMLLLGRGENYTEFREVRGNTKDPYELSKYLSNFSEDSKYSKKIRDTIKYNRLSKFDKEEKKSKLIIN